MVMFVWWILSLFGVCDFTWLPVAIDAGITSAFLMFSNSDSYATNVIGLLTSGVFIFAFCKHFLSLAISSWWILVSPFWFGIATVLPGGYTITNLVFENSDLMVLPTWVLILGIVIDVILLISEAFLIVGNVKDKK